MKRNAHVGRYCVIVCPPAHPGVQEIPPTEPLSLMYAYPSVPAVCPTNRKERKERKKRPICYAARPATTRAGGHIGLVYGTLNRPWDEGSDATLVISQYAYGDELYAYVLVRCSRFEPRLAAPQISVGAGLCMPLVA